MTLHHPGGAGARWVYPVAALATLVAIACLVAVRTTKSFVLIAYESAAGTFAFDVSGTYGWIFE
jgi:hypothetical protein